MTSNGSAFSPPRRDDQRKRSSIVVRETSTNLTDNRPSSEASPSPTSVPPPAMPLSESAQPSVASTTTNATTTQQGVADDSKRRKLETPRRTQASPSDGVTNDNTKRANIVDDSTDERTSKDYYFDSYAHHAIHEEMLKDEVRTNTYKTAILQNRHLFQDKIVLDVGCGTGILSMFASQAGAKKVFAVDCSAIADQAREIVRINGFAENIEVIKGKIEEIQLPVDHVDIIISEWMGYFLLYESMLDTVLFARDKWLVKDGVIFPDKAVMYICGIEDGQVKQERINFWDDVYGFNMAPIKQIAIKEPVVDVVLPTAVVTDAVPILHLDILTCTKDDLAFQAPFKIKATRNDFLHGLVAYFECAFTQVHKPIGFSTAPFCNYTHWKQTLFYLPDVITVCEGEELTGDIACQPNKKNNRDLDIQLSVSFQGQHSNYSKTTDFRLR